MRMLFTFAGGSGHLEPLVPLARAAAIAGHAVAFAGRPWMVPKVEALGLPAFATGSDVGLTPTRLPLAQIDLERDIRLAAIGFGGRIARERAADILALCGDWKPDLLVCEETDFGAMVVAERLTLPHASVLVIAAGSFVTAAAFAGPVNEVRAEHGLSPDLSLAMPGRHLILSPFPPSYRDPEFPLPSTGQGVRLLTTAASQDEHAPLWLTRLGDRPTIYFTLGTVYSMESGDLFERVLAGLRDLPINAIVTVGPDFDSAELGTQPANVHIERYIPQAVFLPRCHAVVSHGGSGSVLGALTYGLPMVLLPMGADQPLNAARCEALGVAQTLPALEATATDVHSTVAQVLEDPSYRRCAQRLRAEIAALPEPEYAVRLLERLA